jgi:hypothetical protein
MTKADIPATRVLRALVSDIAERSDFKKDDALNTLGVVCEDGISTYPNIQRIAALFPEFADGLVSGEFDDGLRFTAFKLAADRLYTEKNRQRRDGMREGYDVVREGLQITMRLLDLSFAEANEVVECEERHAQGAIATAAWDRYLLEQAEIRCRAQGGDPNVTQFPLRDYISADEASSAWRLWKKVMSA